MGRPNEHTYDPNRASGAFRAALGRARKKAVDRTGSGADGIGETIELSADAAFHSLAVGLLDHYLETRGSDVPGIDPNVYIQGIQPSDIAPFPEQPKPGQTLAEYWYEANRVNPETGEAGRTFLQQQLVTLWASGMCDVVDRKTGKLLEDLEVLNKVVADIPAMIDTLVREGSSVVDISMSGLIKNFRMRGVDPSSGIDRNDVSGMASDGQELIMALLYYLQDYETGKQVTIQLNDPISRRIRDPKANEADKHPNGRYYGCTKIGTAEDPHAGWVIPVYEDGIHATAIKRAAMLRAAKGDGRFSENLLYDGFILSLFKWKGNRSDSRQPAPRYSSTDTDDALNMIRRNLRRQVPRSPDTPIVGDKKHGNDDRKNGGMTRRTFLKLAGAGALTAVAAATYGGWRSPSKAVGVAESLRIKQEVLERTYELFERLLPEIQILGQWGAADDPAILMFAQDAAQDGPRIVGTLNDAVFTRSSDIPRTLKKIIVGLEDRHIFDNPGVDPAGVARGILALGRGEGEGSGTSTMPMQVIDVLGRQVFGDEVHERMQAELGGSVDNKMVESLLALMMEEYLVRQFAQENGGDEEQARCSVDEFWVAAYLNIIPFGVDADAPVLRGVRMGAERFFDLRTDDGEKGGLEVLTLREQVALALLPSHPHLFDMDETDREELIHLAFSTLVKNGVLDADEVNEDLKQRDMPHLRPSGERKLVAYDPSRGLSKFDPAYVEYTRYLLTRSPNIAWRMMHIPGGAIELAMDPLLQEYVYNVRAQFLDDHAGQKDVLIMVMGEDGDLLAVAGHKPSIPAGELAAGPVLHELFANRGYGYTSETKVQDGPFNVQVGVPGFTDEPVPWKVNDLNMLTGKPDGANYRSNGPLGNLLPFVPQRMLAYFATALGASALEESLARSGFRSQDDLTNPESWHLRDILGTSVEPEILLRFWNMIGRRGESGNIRTVTGVFRDKRYEPKGSNVVVRPDSHRQRIGDYTATGWLRQIYGTPHPSDAEEWRPFTESPQFARFGSVSTGQWTMEEGQEYGVATAVMGTDQLRGADGKPRNITVLVSVATRATDDNALREGGLAHAAPIAWGVLQRYAKNIGNELV